MTTLRERAAAKVNLTLEVLGRRPDGYHELKSLVAFATDAADILSATPGSGHGVRVVGPFASRLSGTNLIETTLARVRASIPVLTPFLVTLEKFLPVASGIGGGSADAAATLRLARRFDPGGFHDIDFVSLAATLGADVPVCIDSRAAMMSGLGERLAPVALPEGLAIVLVNTLEPVPPDKTKQVFAALAAKPLHAGLENEAPPVFNTIDELLVYAARSRNDLEPLASRMFPQVEAVLATLRSQPDCRFARLSGAGPTCFGVFPGMSTAKSAAIAIQAAHAGWWVTPSRLT